MKSLSMMGALLALAACAGLSQPGASVIDDPKELRAARAHFQDKNFERAEEETQKYLNDTKDVYWRGQAYLLLGEIRETSGRESEALEAYKAAVTHGAGYHSAIMAQGLYRISWIYERMARYEDLLATLLDLQKSLHDGDNFIKWVETPARLANTYYVLGFWDKAQEYRRQTLPNRLSEYKHLAKSEMNLFQAQLYLSFMVLKPTEKTPKKSKEILDLVQRDLLEVGEMAPLHAAESALRAIESEYQRYFEAVASVPAPRSPVALARHNRAQVEAWADFVDSLEALSAHRRPPELVANQQLNLEFFRRMDLVKNKARDAAHAIPIGIQKAEKPGRKGPLSKTRAISTGAR